MPIKLSQRFHSCLLVFEASGSTTLSLSVRFALKSTGAHCHCALHICAEVEKGCRKVKVGPHATDVLFLFLAMETHQLRGYRGSTCQARRKTWVGERVFFKNDWKAILLLRALFISRRVRMPRFRVIGQPGFDSRLTLAVFKLLY